MAKRKSENEEVLRLLGIIAEKWLILEDKKIPLIKRWQCINFVIMLLVLSGVVFLAYMGKIDGSAATGLIGAVIGYVFGSLYVKERK